MRRIVCSLAALIWLCGTVWAEGGERSADRSDATAAQATSQAREVAPSMIDPSSLRREPRSEGEARWPEVSEELGVPHTGSIFQAGENPISPDLPGKCGGEPYCNQPGYCCCCMCTEMYGIWACVAFGDWGICEMTVCQENGD